MSETKINVVEKSDKELKDILIEIIRNANFHIHEVADLSYDVGADGNEMTINVLSIRYDVNTGQVIPDKDRFDQAMDSMKAEFFKPFK